jgi:Flp pilus assembly protein TadD
VSGYVVCAFCGARIRADRNRCLRCGELLEAAVQAPAPPALAQWLKSSPPRSVSIVAVSAVAALVAVVVYMKSDSATDTVARPVPTPVKTTQPRPAATAARPAGSGEMLFPPNAADSVRLGAASFNSGDFESAKSQYQQALKNKPDDPEALNGLGLILERQGALDDAIALFMRAAAAAPNKWAYRFNLGHAWGERGQWDAAVEEYRAAAGLFPDDYATRYNLALAMHKKGDDAAAVPEFRKAIEMAPREPSFHLSLAMSLEKTGQLSEAQQEYQKYLEMMPWAPEAEKLKDHLKSLSAGKPAP